MTDIIKTVYRGFLTLNATILLAFIYAVKCRLFFDRIGGYSIFIYIIVILLFTALCLKGREILPNDSIEGICTISMANDTYMPSYLGYFFVALSIQNKDWLTFGVVFCVIYIFTFFSQSLYFNPLFLIFGYNFYYVTSHNQTKIFVISRKKDIRGSDKINFNSLKRVNEFTFIDKER